MDTATTRFGITSPLIVFGLGFVLISLMPNGEVMTAALSVSRGGEGQPLVAALAQNATMGAIITGIFLVVLLPGWVRTLRLRRMNPRSFVATVRPTREQKVALRAKAGRRGPLVTATIVVDVEGIRLHAVAARPLVSIPRSAVADVSTSPQPRRAIEAPALQAVSPSGKVMMEFHVADDDFFLVAARGSTVTRFSEVVLSALGESTDRLVQERTR